MKIVLTINLFVAHTKQLCLLIKKAKEPEQGFYIPALCHSEIIGGILRCNVAGAHWRRGIKNCYIHKLQLYISVTIFFAGDLWVYYHYCQFFLKLIFRRVTRWVFFDMGKTFELVTLIRLPFPVTNKVFTSRWFSSKHCVSFTQSSEFPCSGLISINSVSNDSGTASSA